MHLPQTEEMMVVVVIHQIDQLDHPLLHMIRGLGLRLAHHLAYGHMVVAAEVSAIFSLGCCVVAQASSVHLGRSRCVGAAELLSALV